MSDWRPIETAPYGAYALFYGAHLPWSDKRGDPKRVVGILEERNDALGKRVYVDTFGPSRHNIREFTHWQPLPEPPQ